MPRVGKKNFSYDDEGYAAAQAEADRTGKSMITGYARGGSVDDLLEEGARTVSDADRRKLASSVKLLVTNKNDLYRTFDYKKMRKESALVFLDDLESLPRRLLKEAAK